jgi:hypothetical protein
MNTAKLETPRYLVKVNLTDREVTVYDKILNDTYQGEYEPSTLHPGKINIKARTHVALTQLVRFQGFIEAAYLHQEA